jgi:hypothetical protein
MTKPLASAPGKGYRRTWTCCQAGHLTLEADPRRPGLRICRQCARLRARDQYLLIQHAAGLLGMTFRAYKKRHGQSAGAALAVIALCESEASRTP